MEEIWKRIKDFEDYEVSNQGRVKSFKKWNGTNVRILKPRKNSRGYLYVILCKNRKRYTKKIHRLVLETFKPIENLNKLECNHIDGNKENNYIENLEWVTKSENEKHAYRIGLKKPMKGENNPMFGMRGENCPNYGKHTSEETKKKQSEKMKGENNPKSILTEKDVVEIRKLSNEGILTQKEIGEKFGVDNTTISRIKTGKRWSHV